VADQPAGDRDQPPPQGSEHGLAAAHAVPGQDVLAGGAGGKLASAAQQGLSRLHSDREPACTVTLPICIAVKMVDSGDAPP
jgi:hypothetical protein